LTSATFGPRARREFTGAADWIARDNPRAAQSFRDAIARAAELIGNRPQMGSKRPRLLNEPFRFWPVAGFSYLIVYNSERVPPEIIAIIHTSRDLPRVLRDL
jgi:toxin ParE1/3/4